MSAPMSTYMRTVLAARIQFIAFCPAPARRGLGRMAPGMPLCKYFLTPEISHAMLLGMTTLSKKKALLAFGILNPNPEKVRSPLFDGDFFDPCDRAQVKYEMLRTHSVDGDPVAEACREFGFSRESFYHIQQAFRELGFSSFLPGRRGRKGPVKLKGEVLQFAFEIKKENPEIDPGRLAALIGERYGIEIHRTTVMRGMKKKRRSPAEGPAARIRRKRRSGTGTL